MELITVKLNTLIPDDQNARIHDARNTDEIMCSLRDLGQHRPFVVQRGSNKVIVGNGMLAAMKALGWEEGAAYFVDDDDETAIKRALADNRTAELAEWDDDVLRELFAQCGDGAEIPGWSGDEIAGLLGDADWGQGVPQGEQRATLAERFGVPPFSVLNAREGYWQDRKRAWIALGIQSEVGRGEQGDSAAFKGREFTPAFMGQKEVIETKLGRQISNKEFKEKYFTPDMSGVNSGISIFDPVLCELAYRWFSCEGDTVLDPFAGGSVRGIVGSRLGRQYIGVELRPEQVAANEAQKHICADPLPRWITGDSTHINTLTDNAPADLILTCPPYADLEVYSDMPEDLSNMTYTDFIPAYRAIAAATCAQLKDDRFAVVVVSEVRDKRGSYYGFVPDTVCAFEDAGMSFYNEAILINPIVSARLRAGRYFESSRKLCRTHQNVLVFCKGNPKKATERLGSCEFGEITEDQEE